MDQATFTIRVEDEDERLAGQEVISLANALRDVPGVTDSERRRAEQSTMDLGAVLTIVATSGATVAIARGIADWLRLRRGARLKIERNEQSGSIKAEIQNIDSSVALRIVELIRGA